MSSMKRSYMSMVKMNNAAAIEKMSVIQMSSMAPFGSSPRVEAKRKMTLTALAAPTRNAAREAMGKEDFNQNNLLFSITVFSIAVILERICLYRPSFFF
jgi:hypothetical protein